MPAAAEPVVADDASRAPRPARRKLLVLAASAALLAGAGGGAVWTLRRRQAAAAAALEGEAGYEDGEEGAALPVRRGPPAFLPLDSFVVNLADRDTDRYAQIGITLELEDEKHAAELKAYMPAIRNGILMVLAHKTSQELLSRPGKEQLAAEIMRETMRPLGIPAEAPGAASERPVRHVHFSSFIIQ
jgi:flagellar FliL protein